MNDKFQQDKIKKVTFFTPEEEKIVEQSAQKTFRSTSGFIRYAAVKEANKLSKELSKDE